MNRTSTRLPSSISFAACWSVSTFCRLVKTCWFSRRAPSSLPPATLSWMTGRTTLPWLERNGLASISLALRSFGSCFSTSSLVRNFE